jgi:hypothetical protein
MQDEIFGDLVGEQHEGGQGVAGAAALHQLTAS